MPHLYSAMMQRLNEHRIYRAMEKEKEVET